MPKPRRLTSNVFAITNVLLFLSFVVSRAFGQQQLRPEPDFVDQWGIVDLSGIDPSLHPEGLPIFADTKINTPDNFLRMRINTLGIGNNGNGLLDIPTLTEEALNLTSFLNEYISIEPKLLGSALINCKTQKELFLNKLRNLRLYPQHIRESSANSSYLLQMGVGEWHDDSLQAHTYMEHILTLLKEKKFGLHLYKVINGTPRSAASIKIGSITTPKQKITVKCHADSSIMSIFQDRQGYRFMPYFTHEPDTLKSQFAIWSNSSRLKEGLPTNVNFDKQETTLFFDFTCDQQGLHTLRVILKNDRGSIQHYWLDIQVLPQSNWKVTLQLLQMSIYFLSSLFVGAIGCVGVIGVYVAKPMIQKTRSYIDKTLFFARLSTNERIILLKIFDHMQTVLQSDEFKHLQIDNTDVYRVIGNRLNDYRDELLNDDLTAQRERAIMHEIVFDVIAIKYYELKCYPTLKRSFISLKKDHIETQRESQKTTLNISDEQYDSAVNLYKYECEYRQQNMPHNEQVTMN